MADYFPVLSRAVAGLENSTDETRRAVYERARAAITRQLRAIDPPLSDEDVSRERMQLEEAIRRVEADATGGAPATPAAAARPPASKPPEREQPRAQAAPAQQPSRPAARPPERDDERAPPPGRSDPSAARPAGPPQQRPAKRADGRPIIKTAGEQPEAVKSRRSGPLIAIGALAVIALASGLFLARDRIFGTGSDGGEQQQASQTTEPSEPSPAAPSEAAGDKADDRLAQDEPAAAPPAGQSAPAEQEVARGPDPTAPAPEAPPAPPPAIAPVAQRAVLYEEGPNQQSGEALNGTIIWRTESVNGGQSQPLETAIRGDVDIPGRNVKATLTIRRNADATLPASHTIEIQFTLPENFPNAGVSNVPGVLMKADESARGAAVAGLSVRVTNGFFLIGLSNLETERSVNEQLLRDRGWIDIPILYDNGRRAVLTLEKGTPGAQAFQDAFSAWRSASAGAPASGTAR